MLRKRQSVCIILQASLRKVLHCCYFRKHQKSGLLHTLVQLHAGIIQLRLHIADFVLECSELVVDVIGRVLSSGGSINLRCGAGCGGRVRSERNTGSGRDEKNMMLTHHQQAYCDMNEHDNTQKERTTNKGR